METDIKRIQYLFEYKFKESAENFPTFDKYINDQELNEVGPEQPIVEPEPAPVPQTQPTQQSVPAPAPQAPEQPVSEPQQVEPDLNNDNDVALMGIDTQLSQTDEILSQMDVIKQKLASIECMNAELIDSYKEFNKPDAEKEEDMKQSSWPFNVSMKDYFNVEDEKPINHPKFKITPEDIKNYSRDEIKNSFNIKTNG